MKYRECSHWGINYETLQNRNVQKMDRIYNKLMSFCYCQSLPLVRTNTYTFFQDPYITKSIMFWRYDTQHNDAKHNDIQHYDIQHYDIQHYDIQHYDTQHNHTNIG